MGTAGGGAGEGTERGGLIEAPCEIAGKNLGAWVENKEVAGGQGAVGHVRGSAGKVLCASGKKDHLAGLEGLEG